MKKLILMLCLTLPGLAQADELSTLSNFERARAELIETYLDPSLSADERKQTVQRLELRLVDLERMLIRDHRVNAHDSRLMRLAFSNYDLSFLVHASAERNVSGIDHWLSEMGLNRSAILSAEPGPR